MKYRKHIFVCTNERPAGGKASCGDARGMELVQAFREALRQHHQIAEVRAQKAGCLDVCEHGPAVAVYPEGVFYGHLTVADIPEIVEKHIVGGEPVERLRLRFEREY